MQIASSLCRTDFLTLHDFQFNSLVDCENPFSPDCKWLWRGAEEDKKTQQQQPSDSGLVLVAGSIRWAQFNSDENRRPDKNNIDSVNQFKQIAEWHVFSESEVWDEAFNVVEWEKRVKLFIFSASFCSTQLSGSLFLRHQLFAFAIQLPWPFQPERWARTTRSRRRAHNFSWTSFDVLSLSLSLLTHSTFSLWPFLLLLLLLLSFAEAETVFH